MEKKSTSLSAFFDLCVLIALVAFLADVFLALFGFGAFSNAFAQAKVSARGSTALSSGGVTSETIELQQVASGLTPAVTVTDAGDRHWPTLHRGADWKDPDFEARHSFPR